MAYDTQKDFITAKMTSLIVFIYFFIASLFVTFPLILHLHDYTYGIGDELLITWIFNWDIYSLLHNPFAIFSANIYYPYPNTLSFSDIFITLAIIVALPTLIVGEPMVAFNSALIVSLTTLGFFTYLLTFYLTKNIWASIISGTLIAFSVFTLGRITHLQIVAIQCIPLSLLFFFKFADTGRLKYFVLTMLFFVLQIYNSFLPAYFLIFLYSTFLVIFYFRDKKKIKPFFTKKIIGVSLVALILIMPVVIPYIQTSITFNFTRDIRDSIHFANRPEYFLYPNSKTKLQDTLLTTFYKEQPGLYVYEGYFGMALIVLSIFALVYVIKNRRTSDSYSIGFLFLSIFSFILSLGPAFQWAGRVIKEPFIIPLPYALFYYILPGFKGFRNSARWEMLTVFCLSILIGIVLAKLLQHKTQKVQIVIALVVCALVLGEINVPFSYEKVETKKEFPKVYSYLATLPKDAVIIELPMYNWDMQPYSLLEIKREYYSTIHFKKMVNGYSGFSPYAWEEQTRYFMNEFPDEKVIKHLQKIGVDYIIVHSKEYNELEKNKYTIKNKKVATWREIKKMFSMNNDVEFVKQFSEDYLYKLK